MTAAPLLDVRGLRKFFPISKGLFRRTVSNVRAVDDVSFTVQEGEALGLVGESGCGKTTTARCILRAIDRFSRSSARNATCPRRMMPRPA